MDRDEFIANLMLRGFKWVNKDSIVDSLTRNAEGAAINVLMRTNHVSIHIRTPFELQFDHDSSPPTRRKALKRIDFLIGEYT